MPQARTEHLIEIVGEAIRRPPAERDAFVRAACPDPDPQREALSLLSALERAGPFMDRPTVLPSAPATLKERPGTTVGRYTLLEQIGEGGFGIVFRAEQREPVRREVALKIIKLGMDTAAVVARFEAERQTLALMDHPCIAKVLDGGATDTGRPYFVMELVHGEPITRYAQIHALGSHARLDLFIQVCRAVQHAHAKGIIHRDLKPANVLVTQVDGRPVPRIIDFGIAKATATNLAGKAAFTELRQFVGTPEYMSPEQSPGVDIDTRSDIYSLGVLLYELLTGVTPLDPQRLRSAAWDQMLRMIREENPPRPSTRISTLALHAPAGGPPPRETAAGLRGDLDWIVMRCLEKDRARRYQTADGLAADIERHLKGDAVLAAPPSRAYQLRKFVGRNRAGVAAAAVAILGLLVGLSAALWQAGIAARERDAAEARRRETEQVAAFQAAQLSDIDPQIMGSRLRDDLLAADAALSDRADASPGLAPLLARLNMTDVALRTLDRNIFSRAIAAIDEQFTDQPALRADLLMSVSETMSELGLFDAAEAPMREALAIRRQRAGEDHPSTLRATVSLGSLLLRRGKLPESEALLESALDRSRRIMGSDDPLVIETLRSLGMLRASQSRIVDSERIYSESLERAERIYGPDDPRTLRSAVNLGVALLSLNGRDRSEALFRRAYEGHLKLRGPDHRETVKSLGNLANCLRISGKFDEAEPLLRESLRAARSRTGDLHPDTMFCCNNLAMLLSDRAGPGDLAEADSLLSETLNGRRLTLGPGHRDTLTSLYNLATLRRTQGRHAEAEPLFRETIAQFEAANSGATPLALMARLNLARSLTSMSRFAESEQILLSASATLAAGHGGAGAGRGLGGSDPCARDLVDLYTAWDRADPGTGHDLKAAEWQLRLPPPADPPVGPG